MSSIKFTLDYKKDIDSMNELFNSINLKMYNYINFIKELENRENINICTIFDISDYYIEKSKEMSFNYAETYSVFFKLYDEATKTKLCLATDQVYWSILYDLQNGSKNSISEKIEELIMINAKYKDLINERFKNLNKKLESGNYQYIKDIKSGCQNLLDKFGLVRVLETFCELCNIYATPHILALRNLNKDTLERRKNDKNIRKGRKRY